MPKITTVKFNLILGFVIFFFFNCTNNYAQTTPTVTGVSICKGGTGVLTATNATTLVSSFKGYWNAETDPKALVPHSVYPYIKNSSICEFSPSITGNYKATTFTVPSSGNYVFKMKNTDKYDAMAYIFEGNFTLGNCNAGGRWIIGDDDYDGYAEEPRLITYLEQGKVYTLISTLWTTDSFNLSGEYEWAVTPKIHLNTLNYWYTSSTGGVPIGWGDTFNPVGVPRSGLSDTDTAGTTTYYVSDGNADSPRTPVEFVIKESQITTQTIPTTSCPGTIYENYIISKVTSGQVTGIGTPAGLPLGITAVWSPPDNTIRINGSSTETGYFRFEIPLLSDDCLSYAKGEIIVESKPQKIVTTIRICSREKYIWPVNNIEYSTPGIYTVFNDECTADQELELKVQKPEPIITNETIYFGERYIWPVNGQEYTTPQNGLTIINDECTADQVLNLAVIPRPVTGVSICKGGSGVLTAAHVTKYVSSFKGYWNAETDPRAFIPATSMENSPICEFESSDTSNYTATTFSVPTSGNYIFKMKDTDKYDAMAYIYEGDLTPGNCSGGGRLVVKGDNDTDLFTEPRLTAYLEAGTVYTLISTLHTPRSYTGEYQWDVTPKIQWNALNYWYTSSTGGTPIGWGGNFNPVGVPGSGLSDTNTAGTTTYYVSDENADAPRTPADFVIKENIIATHTNLTACTGTIYENYIISEVTSGKVTGIGMPTGFPLGITADWSPSDNTIRINGSPNEIGDFSFKIPLLADDCMVYAEGEIVVESKPEKIVTQKTICFGEKYIWPVNNIEYSTYGIYTVFNDGCTADQELQLTITPKPKDIIIKITVCEGENYTPLPSEINDGCTADVIYNYIVTPKPQKILTQITICSGEKYTWPANNIEYSVSGIYTVHNDVCTADQELQLTVTPKPEAIITNATIYSGEKYIWPANGSEYTTSQNGLTIINDGCTADQVLNLTVNPKTEKIATGVSICKGGSGVLTATNAITSASTFKGYWNVKTDPRALIPLTSMANSPFCEFEFSDTSNYTATTFTVPVSGTYMFKMKDTREYDAMAYIYEGDFTPGICDGGGRWIIGDDDYDDVFAEPRLTAHLEAGTLYTLICTLWDFRLFNGEYQWDVTPQIQLNSLNYWYTSSRGGAPIGWGNTFNPVGVPGSGLPDTNTAGKTTYYVSDGNADSPRTPVDFVIKESQITTQTNPTTTCTGNVYENYKISEVTSGQVTGIGTPTGLPSGITAVWSPSDNTIKINGNPTETGVFRFKIPLLSDDCGVDAEGEIVVESKPEKKVTQKTICSGEKYTWPVNNLEYSASGIFTVHNDGCTADQELQLTVTPKPADINIITTVCEGEFYIPPYKEINDGCTADVVYNYIVIRKPEKIVTQKTICSGEKYTWPADNIEYSASGIFTVHNDGCTADQELQLNVTPKPADINIITTVCAGENYIPLNKIINDGCTADVVYHYIVTPKPEKIVTQITICSGEKYTWPADNIEYSASGIYTLHNDGCTADQELQLTVTPKPADIVRNITVCEGESYTPLPKEINDGCTADVVYNYIVTPKPEKIVTQITICSGEKYTWPADNIEYSASGIYTVHNDGCTADQELQLTVTPKPADIVRNITVCEGESYTPLPKEINDRCTADVIYNYIVTPKPTKVVTQQTICSGEKYIWPVNNIEYSASGIYTVNNDGCTSDQELQLTVTPKPEDIIRTVTVCAGENYTPRQKEINDGCTADVVYHYIVTPKPTKVVTQQTICSGEKYTWPVNNIEYSASGIYTVHNDGCTSDQELQLTVTPKPADIVRTITVCEGEIYTPLNKIINYGCTADVVYHYIVTLKREKIVTQKTICSGEKYIWPADNIEYSVSGIYTVHNDGCAADQELQLTVNEPLNVSIVPDSMLPEICVNDHNGQFSIEISGGQKPYRVAVDNIDGNYIPVLDNQYIAENLTGKNHSVYVKDLSNCITELKVQMQDAILLNPIATITYGCTDNLPSNTVSVTIDKSTNPTEVDYSLDGDPSGYQNSTIFTNVPIGKHFIRARHSGTCEKDTPEFSIEEIQPLSLELTNNQLNEIVATATGGTGSYQYSFENDSFGNNNTFIIQKTGTYTIKAIDRKGCSVTKTIYVEFIDVCIPNYFTPNGDGINDLWGPECADNYKNLTYSIFDRHGRIIVKYNFGQKWDGKYNGATLPSGDYWYVIKLNDSKDDREFVGHFTLYR